MVPTLPFLLVLACLLGQSLCHKKLGINCRGSGRCHTRLPKNYNLVTAMYGLFSTDHGPIAPETIYHAGPDIACYEKWFMGKKGWLFGGICLFMQGNVPPEGVNASIITQRLGNLKDHGCKRCGSVPLSGDNDPDAMGILTINYVADEGGCKGVYYPMTGTPGATNTTNGEAKTFRAWAVGVC